MYEARKHAGGGHDEKEWRTRRGKRSARLSRTSIKEVKRKRVKKRSRKAHDGNPRYGTVSTRVIRYGMHFRT